LWSRKQGPEVTYFSAPTQDTIPLKQDKFQQEMSQWKNHDAVWTAGLPVISLYIIGSLFFISKSSFIFLFSAGRQNQYWLKSFFYKITNIVQILYRLTNMFRGFFCKKTYCDGVIAHPFQLMLLEWLFKDLTNLVFVFRGIYV